MSKLLLLPGDEGFNEYLDIPPPCWGEETNFRTGIALVKDLESGLMREEDERGFWEYAFGGEYDELCEDAIELEFDSNCEE